MNDHPTDNTTHTRQVRLAFRDSVLYLNPSELGYMNVDPGDLVDILHSDHRSLRLIKHGDPDPEPPKQTSVEDSP